MLLYEVHTRQWLAELGVSSLAVVDDDRLDELARIGVTHLWLMGVWPTGPLARAQAVTHAGLRVEYDRALPGWSDDDVHGSPYAIAAYRVDDALGGDTALAALRARLATRGIRVILDFVPNHVGLDHAWVETPHVMREAGVLVHGKDPYFPGWTDTAQLEYRRAATRAAMREVLCEVATRCDGVRCDMAMLVLPDVFEKTWAHVPCDETAAEFWPDAIAAVRRTHPEFMFLAEAYWGLEDRLCAAGFDLAYDKELYDHVVKERVEEVAPHLAVTANARRLHFLENHDEPRAAALPVDLHRAAALLVLGLPGLALLHHGQRDGARRFARIQLARRAVEPVNRDVRASYDTLLAAVAASSVGQGTGTLLVAEPAWPGSRTHASFVIVLWAEDLVVVNLAPERAQCRVRVPRRGLWRLVDRLGDERWERDFAEVVFLDLPARGAQLFALQRMT